MRIIYVDDEKSSIQNFDYYAKGAPSIKQISYFSCAQDALTYATENPFEVAFLDIQMPDMSGFALSRELKKLRPDIEIIYVTAFNDYHQEAYLHGGRAYLLKPFQQSDLDEVFVFLRKLKMAEAPVVAPLKEMAPKPPVFIQTFGNFDLWVNGEPVLFKTAKAKELLAVLVDHRGSVVSNIEIFNFLWPDKTYSKSTSTYVRKVVQTLRTQLNELGCGNIVSCARNAHRINAGAAVCDCYCVLAGDVTYLPSYNGYYMSQYSWAEESIFIVEQHIKILHTQGGKPATSKASASSK